VLFFLGLVGVHLVCIGFEIDVLAKATKVLLIPSIGDLFWSNMSQLKQRNTLLHALFFCWLGDTILLFPTYFLGGLVAFLIGHLLYIRLLFPSKKMNWIGSGLLVLFGISMAYQLGLHVDDTLRIPVFGYLFVITNMGILAVSQMGEKNKRFWLALGGILFIVSDSFLAWNKFIHPFATSGIAVMSTYIAAQYSLVRGFVTS
jgi:uncharacterized membrane protein YhhN